QGGGFGCCLNVGHEWLAERMCGGCRGEHADTVEIWDELTQDSDALASEFGVHADKPVTLPPGSDRLLINPDCNGAPATITIGIVLVAAMAALTAGVKWATITATSLRTSSLASSAARSLRPCV